MVNDDVLQRLAAGEWVECSAVQKALNITFAEGLHRFDFCRIVEWWSLAGKTEEERARSGQKVSTYFRLKAAAQFR